MKRAFGFSFLAVVSFTVFGLAVYGIMQAQNAPLPAYIVYLEILGIVAGLGSGISFIGRAIKAANGRE